MSNLRSKKINLANNEVFQRIRERQAEAHHKWEHEGDMYEQGYDDGIEYTICQLDYYIPGLYEFVFPGMH